MKNDDPSSSQGLTVPLTFSFLRRKGNVCQEVHRGSQDTSQKQQSPVIPAGFGQLGAAFFVHISCVPICADKSLEEYNFMLTPGSYYNVCFVNRETQVQAPMQMLALCL